MSIFFVIESEEEEESEGEEQEGGVPHGVKESGEEVSSANWLGIHQELTRTLVK